MDAAVVAEDARVGEREAEYAGPAKDGKFDGQLDGAGVFSFTFTDAGVYAYYCSLHSSMNATVTVK